MEIEPPQPPAHRLPLTCELHPNDNFTGFCASCLRERLQALESSTSTATTHRNSTSTISSSLLKSIFSLKPIPSSSTTTTSAAAAAADPSSSSASELRRCKSFSFSSATGAGPRLSTSFEPQRKSCDVRGRNTLWSLFNQDGPHFVDNGNNDNANINDGDRDEIVAAVTTAVVADTTSVNEVKPMKDHIDLESHSNNNNKKQIYSSSFWIAASVFSKKLQKWRRKQKLKRMKKHEGGGGGGGDGKPDPKSSSSRRFHETQSEIAVDAFGRRSCDFAPRFSLDAGRISFDDPRYSFDEPRASWDGYLIGSRSLHPRLPPMLSVVEDVPPTPMIHRSDGQIPVEEDLTVPGGSQQTKDYYSDSSSRSRRRSLDRSNSVKKLSVEMNEPPVIPHSTEFLREWSSNSLRDDLSESFESVYREDSNHKLPPKNKSKRWSKAWSIWGFIQNRRNASRGGDNVVERSFSEIWPNGYTNGRILRSNSNVSSRSSIYNNAGFWSMRKNGLESNWIGKKKKKKRDEFVLERNRSARFSPGHVDNGMLRFYLTPMNGSRRASGMSRHHNSYHSFTRSMLRLY